jgi:hypothetical protein
MGMTTADVRQAAGKMLDGMKFNKEKLARDCLAVCDQVDRLNAALAQEQQKNAALMKALEDAKKGTPFSGFNPGAGKDFANMFGDIFKPTGQSAPPR